MATDEGGKQLNETDALTFRTITHVLVIALFVGCLKDQIHGFTHFITLPFMQFFSQISLTFYYH